MTEATLKILLAVRDAVILEKLVKHCHENNFRLEGRQLLYMYNVFYATLLKNKLHCDLHLVLKNLTTKMKLRLLQINYT